MLRQSAPKWLDIMISMPEWRDMIYQLSEKNKDCMMLNFAIQKISEAGHQDEIANVSSVTNFFRVFHRVLSDSVSNLMLKDDQTIQDTLATTAVCSSSSSPLPLLHLPLLLFGSIK